MAYLDLDAIHVPSAGTRPPASWGAQVNANFDEVYTELLAKLAGWTTYVPTLTQGVGVSKTVTRARYVKLGRIVVTQGLLSVTSSGTAANQITVSVPATAAYGGTMAFGSGYVYDTSTNATHSGIAFLGSTTLMAFTDTASSVSGGLGYTGTSFAAALASGDAVSWFGVYESAS